VKFGSGDTEGCCLSPILPDLQREYITKEGVEGFGDFKVEGHVISSVKYADGLVLLANRETLIQEITYKLIEIGRCYRMEMN
jgi:hypothetical protein